MVDHVEDTAWNGHGNTAISDGTVANILKIEEGSLLIEPTNPLDPSSAGETPTAGAGTRFMYIGAKGAIRCGVVSGTDWDEAQIGINSIAVGEDIIAGDRSAVFGRRQNITGKNVIAAGQDHTCAVNTSVLLGSNNTVTAIGGIAIGDTCSAGGNDSVAMGAGCVAGTSTFHASSIALGELATATGIGAVAIGLSSSATGTTNSIAIGSFATVPISNSMAFGLRTTASGNNSVAFGRDVIASAQENFCLGLGIDINNQMENDIADSMFLGVGSVDPTMIFRNQKVGIIEKNPLSTLDVGGSVGYKQKRVATSPEGSLTLSDELVVIIDTTAGDFDITLPDITANDRRMYHVKNAGLISDNNNVVIVASGTDWLDDGQGSPLVQSPATISITPGSSAQIIANLPVAKSIIANDIIFTAPSTITAESGATLPAFSPGETVTISNAAESNNNGTFTVSTSTSSSLVVTVATLVDEGIAKVNRIFVSPDEIQDSDSAFTIYSNGDVITVAGSTSGQNDGDYTVNTSSTSLITTQEQTVISNNDFTEFISIRKTVTITQDNPGNPTWWII